uniref:Uncharacterized protein n=1 Tax=Rhizophora mucronata TaxID=61149 RepID=A0A2P2PEN2_RHIMU
MVRLTLPVMLFNAVGLYLILLAQYFRWSYFKFSPSSMAVRSKQTNVQSKLEKTARIIRFGHFDTVLSVLSESLSFLVR